MICSYNPRVIGLQSIADVQAIDARRIYIPKDTISKSIHDRGREYATCEKPRVDQLDAKQDLTLGN